MDRLEFSVARPSACIEVAVADLDACERDPRYRVDMGIWHMTASRFSVPDTCAVCFAGSVMARTLNVNPLCSRAPADFSLEQEKRFHALDYIRCGSVIGALNQMGYEFDPVEVEHLNNGWVAYSAWNNGMFKRWCLSTADRLEELGF